MESNLATTPYFRDYLSNAYVELGNAYDSGQLAIQSESIAYDYYQKAAKMRILVCILCWVMHL